jgi:hypothetical protein
MTVRNETSRSIVAMSAVFKGFVGAPAGYRVEPREFHAKLQNSKSRACAG